MVTESAAPLCARARPRHARAVLRARACRYTLAAESGLVSAQFNLGSMYKKARTRAIVRLAHPEPSDCDLRCSGHITSRRVGACLGARAGRRACGA